MKPETLETGENVFDMAEVQRQLGTSYQVGEIVDEVNDFLRMQTTLVCLVWCHG